MSGKDFLVEIGTEELPSSFVRHALGSMEASAKELIRQARLGSDALDIHTMGTPRRLALRIRGLAERQPDRDEQVMGPPWSAAFEADGSPKKAATGFAKKHGVEVGALKKRATEKGDYVSVQIHEAGKATPEVLADILPEICQRISFPKSMRWGPGEISFGRPIHWIVSLLDREVIGEILACEDSDAFDTAQRLAREEGISAGVSGGAAVWAALQIAQRLGAGKRVVAVIPDGWDRYASVERPTRYDGIDFII